MPCMTTIDHMAFDAIPTLKANLARGYASLTKVLQDKTTVHRAMYREGVGWIDFVWGDEGRWPPDMKGRRKGEKGLAHVLEARQRKDGLTPAEIRHLLHKMVETIAEGEEKRRHEHHPSLKVIIGKDGTEVHLVRRVGANAWTLTVFHEDGGEVAMDAISGAFHPTRQCPTPGCALVGASPVVSGAELDSATRRGTSESGCPAGADDIASVSHAAVHRNLDSTDSDLIARIEAAAQESAFGHNPRPTPSEAQCAAGNYKLGRVDWRGLKLAIEQPRNSYREGTGKNGVKWRTRLAAHYGYISGTRGADGDPVDCFIGPFPTAETAYVINQYVDGRFDEHKCMLCFMDEPSAIRAYLDSYDRGWQGLHSIVPASLTQFRWWLENGNLSRPLTPESLPFEPRNSRLAGGLSAFHKGNSPMSKPMRTVYWDSAACEPREDSIPAILYRLRAEDPGNDLLMDSVSLADIYSEADAILSFDAMVTPYAKLEAKLNILKAVMERSGGAVKPVALQISEPFKQRGVANVAGVFELSDGQTVSVFFHNPDVTPKKIQPADELISWKWLLNKKDITIVVAPEQGHDLNVREVAKRLMKLAEKNSAAFQRANTRRAERMQNIENLKGEVAQKEAELADLNHQIEVAKVEAEERKAAPVEEPPQTIQNASEETLTFVGMNADGNAVYQNSAGARWLKKKNLLTGEATKGGKPVEPREDEYLTAEELAAKAAADEAEKANISTEADPLKHAQAEPAIAASMSSNEIPADKENAHQYRKAAFEIIRDRYGNKPPVPITTKDGSVVLVGMGGLKHVLKDGLPSWQEAVATLHAEEIIAKADYLGSEPDYKKRTEIKAVHRYGASIEIDGEEYGVVVVVMEASDGKRYYDHTVTGKGESPAGLLADPSTNEVDEESGRPFTGLPDDLNINQSPLKSTNTAEAAAGVEVPALSEDIRAKLEKLASLTGKPMEEVRAAYDKWVSAKGEAAALQVMESTIANREAANLASEAGIPVATLKQYGAVLAKKADGEINAVTYANRKQATAAAAKIDVPGIETVVVGNRPFYVKIVPAVEPVAEAKLSSELPTEPAPEPAPTPYESPESGLSARKVPGTEYEFAQITQEAADLLALSVGRAGPYRAAEALDRYLSGRGFSVAWSASKTVLDDISADVFGLDGPRSIVGEISYQGEKLGSVTIRGDGETFWRLADGTELQATITDDQGNESLGPVGWVDALDGADKWLAEVTDLDEQLRAEKLQAEEEESKRQRQEYEAEKARQLEERIATVKAGIGGKSISAYELAWYLEYQQKQAGGGNVPYQKMIDAFIEAGFTEISPHSKTNNLLHRPGQKTDGIKLNKTMTKYAQEKLATLLELRPASEPPTDVQPPEPAAEAPASTSTEEPVRPETETITTKTGSRQVITTNQNTAGIWESRLYVNNGETATLTSAKHKTKEGAIKWANKVLAEHQAAEAPTEDPQKAADTAFLQSVIDGQADILDPDFAGKLEALFGAYANDPDMLDLLSRAITAYSEAMMGKASNAMAA
jgi:hypothetical protein